MHDDDLFHATPRTDLDDADGLATFIGLRSRLFGIAYRVLGSSADAEDVVQEAWLRWQSTDRDVVIDAAAFLATTTTRLAINAASSARTRREVYLGPWLPEPVDAGADPAVASERSEALGLAVFLLLEKLPPTERAAYVLSNAFDYSHAQVAEMLQVSEANARPLASRARKHLAEERHQQVGPAAQRRLLDTFLEAARTGELGELRDVLIGDVGRDRLPGGVVLQLGPRAAGEGAAARGALVAQIVARPGRVVARAERPATRPNEAADGPWLGRDAVPVALIDPDPSYDGERLVNWS